MANYHFPDERNGCYYQRVADCCWLCYLRMVRSAIATRL